MHADEDAALGGIANVAESKSDVVVVIENGAVQMEMEIPITGWQCCLGLFCDEFFALTAIFDEITNGTKFEAVLPCKFL